jgi:hypothetical protein
MENSWYTRWYTTRIKKTEIKRTPNLSKKSFNREIGNDNRYSVAPSCLSRSNIDHPVKEAYSMRNISRAGAR